MQGIGTGYRLLDAVARLFAGTEYHPRRSTQGDAVAAELYEDIFAVARTRSDKSKYAARVLGGSHVLNPKKRTVGITIRRGDGTFGEIVPGEKPITIIDHIVKRGHNAFVEIGCEVKVLATAQQRQARRVENDLRDQVAHFQHRRGSRHPLSVAIVGVNCAEEFCSRIGKTTTLTTGKGATGHPSQEADASRRILLDAKPLYDEFLIVDYVATNKEPFPFGFLNRSQLVIEYGALLARLAGEYEARF